MKSHDRIPLRPEKKKARELRLLCVELTDLMGTCLCSFCKLHAGSLCNAEGECHHPLADKVWQFPGYDNDLEPGDDCWGFRRELPISDIADITGIILANGWKEWAYSIDAGTIEVRGSKESSWV